MGLLGKRTQRLPVNRRFASPLILIKESAGDYVNQKYVPGATEAIAIVGSSQPLSEDERQNLNFGERIREGKVFFLRSQDKDLIRPMRQGINSKTRGDIIQEGNINYEAFSVNSYYLNGHIRCVAFRQENQPDA